MKRFWKISLGLGVLITIVLTGAYLYMYQKPARNVENEKGIEINASQLVKEFTENEEDANKKYLDKAIKLTGIITEISENQEGKSTLLLNGENAFTGVFCTFKENETNGILKIGEEVVIKGICSGMLSDVRIIESILIENK